MATGQAAVDDWKDVPINIPSQDDWKDVPVTTGPPADPLKTGQGMSPADTHNAPESPENPIIGAQVSPSKEQLGGRMATDPYELAKHRDTENKIGEGYTTGLGMAMSIGMPVAGAIDEAAGGSLLPPMMKAGRTILGGYGGGELGYRYGGVPGAIAGGILGGGMGAGLERDPYTGRVPGLPGAAQKFIPDWMSPWKIPKDELERGAFMDEGYKSMIPPPEEEPTFMKLSEGPTANQHAAAQSIARQNARRALIGEPEHQPTPFEGIQVPEMGGRSENIPAMTPAQDFAQRQNAENFVRVPGVKVGTHGVNVIPEPREPFPGENPNYMASVKRKTLNPLAIASKPGAGTQLQQLGEPTIYIPPPDYPGPRRP